MSDTISDTKPSAVPLPQAIREPGAGADASTRDTIAELTLGASTVVVHPSVVIPMLPDGGPGWGERILASTLFVRGEELLLEYETATEPATSDLVLLVEQPGGLAVAAMAVTATTWLHPGRLRLTGRWGGCGARLLDPASLTPTFHPDLLAFRLLWPTELLERWAAVGVLQKCLHDRIEVCPACEGLPTHRKGCPTCGSARLVTDRLLHHYACAYVGFVDEFETGGKLICPKCRTRDLVVGADFEHQTGAHRCLDCAWVGTEPISVGECLRCRLRYPEHQAHEIEVFGYHANRLDPLALAATS